MRAVTSVICLGALLSSGATVSAQTDDAVLRRLDALERENAALRREVNQISVDRHAPVHRVAPSEALAPLPPVLPTHKEIPLVDPADAFTWTGGHIGGFAGVSGWAPHLDQGGVQNGSPAVGGVIGTKAGYDWQTGSLVLGIQGSFLGVVGGQSQYFNILTTKTVAVAALTGRAGLALGRTYIYGVAGAAEILAKSTFFAPSIAVNASSTAWTPAMVLGGGIEYAVTPHWTVSAEADYLLAANTVFHATATQQQIGGLQFPVTYGTTPTQLIATVGAGYKF